MFGKNIEREIKLKLLLDILQVNGLLLLPQAQD